MAFPKYEKYRDSQEAWLGKVPSHWRTLRAKRIFRSVSEKNHPNAPLLSVTQNQGVIPRDDLEQRVVMPVGQLQTFKLVRKDDFVISLRSFQGGIEYSEHTGLVSPAYTVLRKQQEIYSGYLKWLLKSPNFISELNTSVTGIRQGKNIDFEDFALSFLPVPSAEEQERIAAFLDRKTSEIDQAIAQKQRLIELLQEQKSILINQAVTKGLNPNTPLRESGIDWIGKIPQHWSIKRIGFLANLLQTGPFGSQLHQEEYIEGGIPVINPSQLINGAIKPDYKISVSEKTASRLERHKLIEGDIVFGRRGEMGRCGLVRTEEVGWLCGTGSLLFRPKTELVNPEFALIVLGTASLKANLEFISVGATMDNLNTAILSKVPLTIPPPEEQKEIIDEIKNIEASFSNLVNFELHGIDLLNELRQVVIAQAVTGKIKV